MGPIGPIGLISGGIADNRYRIAGHGRFFRLQGYKGYNACGRLTAKLVGRVPSRSGFEQDNKPGVISFCAGRRVGGPGLQISAALLIASLDLRVLWADPRSSLCIALFRDRCQWLGPGPNRVEHGGRSV